MNHSDLAAELREKIVSLTLCCPKGLNVDDCPFRILNELCRGTKLDTLRQMDYAALVGLFDFPASCACPADPRVAAQGARAGEREIPQKDPYIFEI